MSDFFNRTLDNLRDGPLGPAVHWIEEHPRLSAWIVLALGMVILVVIEAQNVGLLPGQWAAIIAATILTAGACVWIISWEDEDEEPEVKAVETKANVAAASVEEPAKEESVKATGSKPAARKTPARRSPTKSGKKSSK
jgi:hypothetical protein